jgi:tRNA pseudouridine55 synthase
MTGRISRYNGVLLFDKPAGPSSHEAVMDIRRAVGQRRVGHTGTLDPLAEGLLVICLGKATKIAQFLSGYDKTYEAEICFGQRSATYDREGIDRDQGLSSVPDLNEDKLQRLLSQYGGRITQKVPTYSAIKVAGRRLYRLARNGVVVNPPERETEIKEILFLGYCKPHLRLRITCSSGTYIRSLADDFGEKLGCGAYLSGLRRLSVGEFSVKQAMILGDVRRHHEADTLHEQLLPYEAVLSYSAITVCDDFKESVICGKELTSGDVVDIKGSFSVGDRVLLKDTGGHVLAVGTAEAASEAFTNGRGQKLFSYVRVLN